MKTPSGLELPDQNNLETALNMAREKLQKVNPDTVPDRFGVKRLEKSGSIFFSFPSFVGPVEVSFPDGIVYFPSGDPLPDFLQVFVLHYLVSDGPTPGKDNSPISFAQVPSGPFYLSNFNQNTKGKLIEHFGQNIELFTQAAKELRWEPGDMGDVSAVTRPFPKVPITFVLWEGDDELPPDANLLFCDTAPDYLPTEDISIISKMLVGSVIKKAAALKGDNL